MKTQTFKQAAIVGFLICQFFFMSTSDAKDKGIEKILRSGKLPVELILQENGVQRYKVTTDYFNRDFYGHFFNKERYQGTYFRALPGGKVKWEDVTTAMVTDEKSEFGEGTPLSFMNGFTYLSSDEMLNAGSFPGFPPAGVNVKNLVWDMMAFEGFAWACFDSLKLNEYYQAPMFNGKVPMGGVGIFENRNILLKWCGISVQNGENCAVIEFLAMDNPLDLSIEAENFKMIAKGRSHYWGTILVSLTDKQIEGATLHEDVILDVALPDGKNHLTNSTRLIIVEKLNEI